MHQIFTDVIELVKAVTSLFGVLSPFIMWWMRRKWKGDIEQKETMARIVSNLDAQAPGLLKDQLWISVEKTLADFKPEVRGRALDLIEAASKKSKSSS